VLCQVSLLADLTPDGHRWALVVQAAVSALISLGIFAARRRVGPRFYAAFALPAATVQLSLGVILSGDPANPAAVLYVAVALFAAYFFTRPVAAAQLAFAAVGYAAALAPIAPPAVALDRWMFTFGVAGAAGVVIAGLRDRLVALARADALTGLANRRAFSERLRAEVGRARREGTPVAVVLVDVDGFKQVNDTRGHDAGDETLRGIARVLEGTRRGHDLAARIGGDEFAVLLTGGDAAAVRALGERTMAASGADGTLPTVSLGAAVAPDDGSTPAAVLAAADGALYAAKQAGRARLVVTGERVAPVAA
jgi:diguanylate cyclase (GGDEF)-like protein